MRNACARHLRDLEHGRARGLKWDLAAAIWALNFFPDVLRLAGGQFEGGRFDLQPSQQFIVGNGQMGVGVPGARILKRAKETERR